MASLCPHPARSLLLLLSHLFLPSASQSISTSEISTFTTRIVPATTSTSSSVPSLLDNSTEYKLKGCYNELPSPAIERALGVTGSYISPIFASNNALTVPLCLESCSTATSSNGNGYKYAAVEDSRNCFCGQILSNQSSPVDSAQCSSRCAADPTTSCGGVGFLTLYESRSAASSNDSSTSLNATLSSLTPTASPSVIPKRTKHVNTTAIWIGIGFGLAGLAAIVALLLWWEQKCYDGRQARKKLAKTPPGRSFIGGHELKQRNLCANRSPGADHERRMGFVGEENIPTSPVPDDERRRGFIGEESIPQSPPPLTPILSPPPPQTYDIQSEEAGRRNREAFETFRVKRARSTTALSSNAQKVPVLKPVGTVRRTKTSLGKRNPRDKAPADPIPKFERNEAFEAWKSGVVPPLPVVAGSSKGESRRGPSRFSAFIDDKGNVRDSNIGQAL